MNSLLHWFTSPEWAQIVKALLHSLWQGAVVALVLAVVMRRLANPVSRYRTSLAALVVLVVAGMFTRAVINSSERQKPAPITIQPIAQNQTAPDYIPPLNFNSPDKIVVTVSRPQETASPSWTAWLALVWLAGAVAMLTRAGVKVAGAEKLRRSCRPLNDERVEKLLSEARRAIGLARKVRIGVTDKLTSPAVVGLFVPMLILPLSLMTTLTPEQIQFVLLHELAHIRRGDYLANLFQFFAESLLFFNPAVWWISHQVRREREACCDALAIELSGAPVDYARTLVHVAEKMMQPAPDAALAMGNPARRDEPSSLIDRVQRLLVPGYRPRLRLTWRAMLVALLLGGVLLVVSAVGTRTTVAAILESKTDVATATNSLAALGESQAKHSEIKVPVFDQARSNLIQIARGMQSHFVEKNFQIDTKTLEGVKTQYSEKQPDFNQARSILNQVARDLNMPSNILEATIDLDPKSLEQMFRSESLRKYQPFIAIKREWDIVHAEQNYLEAKIRVVSSNIVDAQLSKSAKSSDQELQDIQTAIRRAETKRDEQQINLERTRANLEAIQKRLGISDSQPVDWNRITEETFQEYASYFLTQRDLSAAIALQQVLTKQVLYLQTVLQRARDKATPDETDGPPRPDFNESPSTNHDARIQPTAQTNLMSERIAAVVKQDSNEGQYDEGLDRKAQDLEEQARETQLVVDQAKEKLALLKTQLGVPDNYADGTTNVSEELKSRYKPYLDAQTELTLALRTLDIQTKQAVYFKSTLHAAREEQLRNKTNNLPRTNFVESPSVATNASVQTLVTPTAQPRLRTMTFRIDTYTGFTNLRKESGLPETSSRKEQLQKLFAEAGVTPPLTNILITDEGMLVVRGTQDQMDSVNKVVEKLNGTASNGKTTTSNSAAVEKPSVSTNTGSTYLTEQSGLAQSISLTASNRAVMHLGDMEITADSASFDLATDSVVMEGHVRVKSTSGEVMTGDKVTVNTKSKLMRVENARPSTVVTKAPEKRDDMAANGKTLTTTSTTNETTSTVESTASSTNLFTRSFKVDRNIFLANLPIHTVITHTVSSGPGLEPVNGEDAISAFRKLLADTGVNLDAPKNLSFNDRSGILLVRATAEDLDIIESVVTALNYSEPQVNIKVRVVEIPQVHTTATNVTWFSGTNIIASESSTSNIVAPRLSGILTDPQFRVVKRALEQRQGVNSLFMPEVRTLSGREAQVRMVDVMTVVMGIKPEAMVSPGVTSTNDDIAAAFLYEQVTNGPSVDLIPYVSHDGVSITLNVGVKLTQFMGYDDAPTNSVAVYVNGIKHSTAPPLPHFRTVQAHTTLTVWDGQTIVLGNADGEGESTITDKGTRKNLIVFVTPTLVDSSGNRIYIDEDLPFAKEGIPVQPK